MAGDGRFAPILGAGPDSRVCAHGRDRRVAGRSRGDSRIDLERLLCDEELARATRILPARKRVLWARSRGVLRALLGRYLDRDPRALRFVLGPHGKPALAREGTDAGEDLRFNLSHSGELALVAVTGGREVGIDLEIADRRVTDRRVDELAIAARMLGRAQAERLAELDPRTRERAFLRAWVAHEAVVKCRGLGLGIEIATGRRTRRGQICGRPSWIVGPDGCGRRGRGRAVRAALPGVAQLSPSA